MYYEAHVTLAGDRETVRQAVEKAYWSFSAIDGDPVLGEGVKLYATRHFPAKTRLTTVITFVEVLTKQMQEQGFTVLREKVEFVMYDTKKRSE